MGLSACGGGGANSNLSAPAATSAPMPVSPQPVVQMDVQYKLGSTEAGDVSLLLDIYQASNVCNGRRPVILYVHGGGFRNGSKNVEGIREFSELVNQRGIDVVSINYRLLGDAPVLSDRFKVAAFDAAFAGTDYDGDIDLINAVFAAKEDAVDALNWMESNQSNYCFDTTRLGFAGTSAGAITVMRVAYSLNTYGIDRPEPAAVLNVFGTLITVDDLEFREAPFISIHGQQDEVIPFQESEKLAARADEIGVPYSYYLVENGDHDPDLIYTPFESGTLLDKALDFLEAHLVGGVPIYESTLIEQ